MIYGYNPWIPLDLIPLPTFTKFSWEDEKRAKEIKDLHAQVRERIEKVNSQVMQQVNKHKKGVQFRPGDLVWVHMRKERFPSKRKSKIICLGPMAPLRLWSKLALMLTRLMSMEIMGSPPPSMWLTLGPT